jgi:hypothetical protein
MAKKPVARKAASLSAKTKPHHENVFQRVGDAIEERFLEGAEMATETSSAETNVALAALAAIEGPQESEAKPKAKAAHAKRKRSRPKAR